MVEQQSPVFQKDVSQASSPPQLAVHVHRLPQRRRAVAHIREAAIQVILPRQWPKAFQSEVAERLAQRVQQQFNRDYALVQTWQHVPKITFSHRKDLAAWVAQINAETLSVTYEGVRIGRAKYTHLAQMNTRTRVMTVSRYCLDAVPESALRYLVIHELAHLQIPNHSKAFWMLVGTYVPDYKTQRRLIAAVHRIRLYEAEMQEKPKSPHLPSAVTPRGVGQKLQQLLLRLF